VIVRAWIFPAALALAACSTAALADRGTALMREGNDTGATAALDDAIRDAPT